MVKVISEADVCATIVALTKDSPFYSGSAVPDGVDHLIKVDRIASGETRMIARQDLVIIVEGLWKSPHTGADRILFVRTDRSDEGAGSLLFMSAYQWPELCKVLISTNVPCTESVGGFRQIPVYGDEVAVIASHSESGRYGWIVRRADVRRYLKKKARGNIKPPGRLMIWHEIHLDHNGEQFPVVRIEGWSPPQIPDDVTLWGMTEYTVLFDEKSHIVERILISNGFVAGVPCDRSPIRSVALGKRLPDNLVRKHR